MESFCDKGEALHILNGHHLTRCFMQTAFSAIGLALGSLVFISQYLYKRRNFRKQRGVTPGGVGEEGLYAPIGEGKYSLQAGTEGFFEAASTSDLQGLSHEENPIPRSTSGLTLMALMFCGGFTPLIIAVISSLGVGPFSGARLLYGLSHALVWVSFGWVWSRAHETPVSSVSLCLFFTSIGVFWVFWGVRFGRHVEIEFWANACALTPLYLTSLVWLLYRIKHPPQLEGVHRLLVEEEERKDMEDLAETCRQLKSHEASFLSSIFFWWLQPLLRLGKARQLNQDDLPQVDKHCRVAPSLATFKKHWKDVEDSENIRKRFIRALWRTTRYYFILGTALGTISSICLIAQPFFLSRFIAHLNGEEVYWAQWWGEGNEGYCLAFLLVATTMLSQTCSLQNWRVKMKEGMRARGITIALIYEKLMVMSLAGKEKLTDGKIVNTVSTDANRIEWVYYFADSLWTATLQFVGTIVFLYLLLGWPSLVGAAVMLVMFPLQTLLFRIQSSFTRKQMVFTDERMDASREMLLNMRVVKFYVWEKYFRERILGARSKELAKIAKLSYTQAFLTFFGTCMPACMSLGAFATYVLFTGNDLKPSQAITALTLFNNLKGPLFLIPNALQAIAAAWIAMERVSSVLNADEIGDGCQLISGGNGGTKLPEGKSRKPKKSRKKEEESALLSEGILGEEKTRQNFLGIGENTSRKIRPRLDSGEVWVDGMDIYFDKHEGDSPVISNLKLRIPPGTLTLIVGAFGAGKSVLLKTLLGETYHTDSGSSDQVRRAEKFFFREGASVAYVPQTAWILNDTIRNNIIFGRPYDEERYRETIIACALATDLESLKAGDETEVGERGVTLSGGQKQRVSLARAVYRRDECEYFLFDDPLSALDAHVGQWVFDRVMLKMLRGKTRLIVTHQLQHLPKADRVLVMQSNTHVDSKGSSADQKEEGDGKQEKKSSDGDTGEGGEKGIPTEVRLLEDGTYNALMSREPAAYTSVKAAENSDENAGFSGWGTFRSMMLGYYAGGGEEREGRKEGEKEEMPLEIKRQSSEQARESYKRLQDRTMRNSADGRLVEEEERAIGAVSSDVYLNYFRQVGVFWWTLLVILVALVLISYRASDLWLSRWSSANGERPMFYLGVFALISAGTLVVTLMATVFTSYLSVTTAGRVHKELVASLLKAPMSFYDTTPTGRIANRLSRDQDVVDQQLANNIYFTSRSVLQVVTMAIVTCIIIIYFALVLIPVSVVFYFIMQYYRSSSRELQRLDSTSKSPIFSHLSATLGGLTSIRAYHATERFSNLMNDKIENNMRAFWMNTCMNFWLSNQLNIVFWGVLIVISVLSVVLKIDAGLAGLCITYGFAFCWWVQAAIKAFTRLEMSMNAVERTSEYAKITPEGDSKVTEGKGLPQGWPARGAIELKGSSLRYRPGLPKILKELKVSIQPGMKVGICGRTGAGKSSLMAMLFRLAEPEDGPCLIDGIEIRDLHLSDLRRGIGVIPQDPTIFKSEIRVNLDPYQTYTDQEIWDALQIVQMSAFVKQQPGRLSYVLKGGGELSVGQRQLLCVARALLRKPRVLILDEATASIDYATDKLIQATIREHFKNVTILTIAHRVDTIIDYDRILVLNSGKVAEFGSPSELCAVPGGIFAGLVAESDAEARSRTGGRKSTT